MVTLTIEASFSQAWPITSRYTPLLTIWVGPVCVQALSPHGDTAAEFTWKSEEFELVANLVMW